MSYRKIRRSIIVSFIAILFANGAIAKPPIPDDRGTNFNPMIVKVISEGKSDELKSVDIATITLGAASLVLTGVAVILAIAAIWGYKEMKDAAIKAAMRSARETARKVSREVAKDVATVVAERTAKQTTPFESTAQEAAAVIDNLENDDE